MKWTSKKTFQTTNKSFLLNFLNHLGLHEYDKTDDIVNVFYNDSTICHVMNIIENH